MCRQERQDPHPSLCPGEGTGAVYPSGELLGPYEHTGKYFYVFTNQCPILFPFPFPHTFLDDIVLAIN